MAVEPIIFGLYPSRRKHQIDCQLVESSYRSERTGYQMEFVLQDEIRWATRSRFRTDDSMSGLRTI